MIGVDSGGRSIGSRGRGRWIENGHGAVLRDEERFCRICMLDVSSYTTGRTRVMEGNERSRPWEA